MFPHKIHSGASGILTYGITPPKSDTAPDRITEIAAKTISRITHLDLDALVVYDVQDESARNATDRPFPFRRALDPLHFTTNYLSELDLPKILYRPAGNFTPDELSCWLEAVHQQRFHPVLVGKPSPGSPVKTSLEDAYRLWQPYADTTVLGAVTIPERHARLQDEDSRMLQKAAGGVSFFVSQCVFNLDYAKQMTAALWRTCRRENRRMPTLLFTLTACGSAQTLSFMEWLGIHVPEKLKTQLLQADDMLQESVDFCLNTARALAKFCAAGEVPFGFNIESVAIRKTEIEASIEMVDKIGLMLQELGLRRQTSNTMMAT
ncbi:methylenetetrahydrofolate reductase [Flavihumibacter petaseus]|uniref:Methylenetetrahydrofolate reductase (NAD(P)H) n=1 Tax=Flavihumibacter petaseus NBRC 106054 TaxID=1220578 RepID=A0A0E9N0H0_9BACT|nr:hypothetical protein [Flavihumibacter petaseus]GAO43349.1 hypothetical protein FPE01S_02_04540 [Flavihumibacter petaseus NBRC 106054]